MYIAKLPQHVINRLKAGEVVERPASVIKELVENALDAGATEIEVVVEKAGKQLMAVYDNGTGIHPDDLLLTVERYATSKLKDETDLQRMATYGFRGEALASISEVSQFSLQTKRAEDEAGYELFPLQGGYETKQIPFAGSHGTRVFIKDLFGQIPVRKKFLKSDQTEWKYIVDMVTHYALVHPDKSWKLTRDGKTVYDLKPGEGLFARLSALYAPDWMPHLREVMIQDEQLEIMGYVSDAALTFASSDFFNVFVNNRPVQDKIIKKAVMDAYYRQVAPGMTPFVTLFVQLKPDLLDINVHPRKMEVRFLDPGSMYTRVHEAIVHVLGEQKVNSGSFSQGYSSPSHSSGSDVGGFSGGNMGTGNAGIGGAGISHVGTGYGGGYTQSSRQKSQSPFQQSSQKPSRDAVKQRSGVSVVPSQQLMQRDVVGETTPFDLGGEQVVLIGQLWDMYLVLQSSDALYLIDHHALAERVLFEHMKQEVRDEGYRPEILLHPVSVQYPVAQEAEIAELCTRLAEYGFDVSVLSPGTLVVYSVPHIFAKYQIDIAVLFRQLWGKDDISFDLILDEIFATKSCKASIKAGQRLSFPEMQHLIEDGKMYIPGMFVCQHGRPSAIRVPKKDVDQWFDR